MKEAGHAHANAKDRSRFGHDFEVILQSAKDEAIGLGPMGTRGRSAVGHLLPGDVAEGVVWLASCPVLAARLSRHGFVAP